MSDVPRLRAYLDSGYSQPVLQMARSAWSSVAASSTGTVLVDISRLPMSGVASDASVVAAYAHRFGPGRVQVGVIRHDPQDAPDVYNTDKYDVWEDLPSHPSYRSMVSAASTQDNRNLRQYLAEHVFLTKLPPDDEHHTSQLPATIRILLPERLT